MRSPAYAADEGSVIEAGWGSVGYGKHVYIRHPDGFVTLYAHLSRSMYPTATTWHTASRSAWWAPLAGRQVPTYTSRFTLMAGV